ncbi:MAG: sugar phosphate nucleotidyltransferase [Patescibacteria group bacterium]
MPDIFKEVGIIILAAGKGKRLNCNDNPKVLYKIGGQSLISYILATLNSARIIKENICLVVGFQAEKVKEIIGPGYIYALQKECLGTAHAARTGEKVLPENIKTILVLNGDDSAFYKFSSLNNFVSEHLKNNCDISLLTCEPADPQGLGRVVRDENNKVSAIVEKENMTEELKKIKEISTGTFCIKRSWFKKYYNNLKLIPNLGELGMPSFIGEALKYKANFEAIKLADPNEWFGVNTREQLEEADRRKREE